MKSHFLATLWQQDGSTSSSKMVEMVEILLYVSTLVTSMLACYHIASTIWKLCCSGSILVAVLKDIYIWITPAPNFMVSLHFGTPQKGLWLSYGMG